MRMKDRGHERVKYNDPWIGRIMAVTTVSTAKVL